MENMRVAVASILAVCVHLGRYTSLAGGQSTQPGVTDAFKVFQISPFAIAAFDTDLDGDLDCLIAIREEYDPEHHFAKYIWVFPGVNGHKKENFTLLLREGPSPDKLLLTTDDGKPERIAKFGYTDYKTCAVTEIPFKNIETCILWVTKEALRDIPQNCVHGYEESCGIKLPAFDQETCGALLAKA